MRKIIIFLIFILFYNIYQINTEERRISTMDEIDNYIYNLLKKQKLIGNIKEWTITRYAKNKKNYKSKTILRFNKNGMITEHLYYLMSAKSPLTLLYKYNDKNEIIMFEKIFEGSVDYQPDHTKIEYIRTYDDNNRLIKLEALYRILNKKEVSQSLSNETSKYKYNEKNLVKEIEIYNGNNELKDIEKYIYDDNNNIIKHVNGYISTYDNEWVGSYITNYKYDISNNLIEEGNFISSEIQTLQKYEYNEDNLLIKLIKYWRKGKFETKYVYEYNENNYISKKLIYNEKDKCTFIYEYQYTIGKNNFISKITKAYGKPSLKKKKILYYEYEYEFFN